MKFFLSLPMTLVVAALPMFYMAPFVRADSPLEAKASWSPPTVDEVVERFSAAVEGLGLSEQQVADAEQELRAGFEADRLDVFLDAAAIAVPGFEEHALAMRSGQVELEESVHEGLPAYVRDNLQLWIGRRLTRERMFDEALQQLEGLTVEEVVDPEGLLFFRAASEHALLKKDEAITDLKLLLENREALPVRYRRTAELMLADIEPLKEDTLDEISRLMNDVGRRLELGRTGERVVAREQEVIDKLNKLIEQAEQQQQQQQQQQSSSGSSESQGGSQGSPMEDSRAAGTRGDGTVDEKDLGDPVDWGDLPPAEREEALQQLSQELPTHYREAIEAYFQQLATGSNE